MDLKNKRVIVGMSGGVDSSVSAHLLKEMGAEVIGLFMKNWEEDEKCPAEKDYEDVISVCQMLNIPHYAVNFSKEYWESVFSECLKEFQAGYTPNPDILCNREIKFKVFLKKALEDLEGSFLATGHYCRKIFKNGGWHLARGLDPEKDQSYFLYTLKSESLEKILFPIGHLSKKEVRALAKKEQFITASKRDSTGICFIGKRNFKEFLENYIPPKPGNFETLSGKIIGSHDGMAYYTIGQRKGLKIGGEGAAWYVVGKEPSRNVVFVEQGEDHPALFEKALKAGEPSWVSGEPEFPLNCTAKIRYRASDVSCLVFKEEEGHLKVIFDEPQKAITPHQAIVFYQGEICLGGAKILASCSCALNAGGVC